MKKVLIFTNVLLLGVIAYLLFFDSKKTSSELVRQSSIASKDLKGIITADAAELISHHYAADSMKSTMKIKRDGKEETVNDTKYISYHLDEITAFLDEIKNTSERLGCDKKLGVRMYFAKYPDAETMSKTPSLQDVPKDYANKLTFFLVPTIFINGEYRDFNPKAWTSCDNPPLYVKKGTQKNVNGDRDDDDWIYNHGDLVPPPFPGDEFPPSTTTN